MTATTDTGSTSNTTENTAPQAAPVEQPQPFVPMTQKVRSFVGLNTDTDVQLLRNDFVRVGASVMLIGINPLAGAAALTYSIGASTRDRNAVKLARNITVAPKADKA